VSVADANTPRLARIGLKQSGYRYHGVEIADVRCKPTANALHWFFIWSSYHRHLSHYDRESSSLDYLHLRNFTSSHAAQTYCTLFPECGGYSWEKVRSLGVPYSVVSQQCVLTWRNRDLLSLKEWPWEQLQKIISEGNSPTKL